MAKLVTESAFQLFNATEGDINTLNSLIKDTDVPENYKNDQICNHATQAVEKFLKGWIVYNNGSVEKSHNIDYVLVTASKIDNTFDTIKNDCLELNKYPATVRYGSSISISEHEIKEIKKALNNVITFAPIMSMRTTFESDPQYRKLYDKVTEIKVYEQQSATPISIPDPHQEENNESL